MMDTLSELIVSGVKTATCSAYVPDGEEIRVGQRAVVLNSRNEPVCTIETTKVEKVPFHKISEAFAYKEGEGDRSLEYWRQEHKRFFEENGGFSEDMMLLCEDIKVVAKL